MEWSHKKTEKFIQSLRIVLPIFSVSMKLVAIQIKLWCFMNHFVHIVYAKLAQEDAGDNKAKLMTKLAP